MKKLALVLTPLMLSATLTAQADVNAHVDAYFVPKANFDVVLPGYGSGSVDGDGYGLRGEAVNADGFLANAEYQKVTYDSDIDLTQFRLGIGIQSQGDAQLAGIAEYVRQELGNAEATGLGIHGRATFKVAAPVRLSLQVGVLKLTDAVDTDMSGPEFSVAGSYQLTPKASIFADYRVSSLKDDGDNEFTFKDLRVGGRYTF